MIFIPLAFLLASAGAIPAFRATGQSASATPSVSYEVLHGK